MKIYLYISPPTSEFPSSLISSLGIFGCLIVHLESRMHHASNQFLFSVRSPGNFSGVTVKGLCEELLSVNEVNIFAKFDFSSTFSLDVADLVAFGIAVVYIRTFLHIESTDSILQILEVQTNWLLHNWFLGENKIQTLWLDLLEILHLYYEL